MPRGVEDLGLGRGEVRRDAGDAAVHDQHVGDAVGLGGRVDHAAVLDDDRHGLSNHLFEHRHAHGDAVLHLVQDDGALEVGDFGRQLAAAIDRARDA